MRNTNNGDKTPSQPRFINLRLVSAKSNASRLHPVRMTLALLAVVFLLLCTACNFNNSATSTPTLSVDAIYTAAFQTFTSQQATQFASTPPTDTPAPTLFPTLPPPATFLPFGTVTNVVGGCDSSTYVSDVTVPDGTKMASGKAFVKTWAVLNSGTCPWSTSYHLVFSSGDAMGGTSVAMTSPVPAGQQVQISVNLVAPTADGSYKGSWQMQNDKSQPFGNIITVVITVGAGSTVTPGPSPTGGPTSATGYVTISGKAGAANTTISYTGGTDIVTDAGGNYSFSVPSGWNGTVTPSKGKYVFSPLNRTYTNVTSDQSGQNFTASLPTATP